MPHSRSTNINAAALDTFCNTHDFTFTHALSAAWAVAFHAYEWSETVELNIKSLQRRRSQTHAYKIAPPSITFLELLQQRSERVRDGDTDAVLRTWRRVAAIANTTVQLTMLYINASNRDRIKVVLDSSLSPRMVESLDKVLLTLCQSPSKPI